MRTAVGALALPALLLLSGGPVAAQEGDRAREPPDTLAQVDSTRIRVFEQLEALGRPPGLDSAALARDSARLAREAGRGGGGPGVGIRDSLSRALMELEGYDPTSYSGTSAEFEAASRRLILKGEEESAPQVARPGVVMSADSAIVYDEARERVRAVGNARYAPEQGDPVDSRTMVLDLRSERGSALGARTQYSQGGTDWYIRGDLPSVESDIVYGSHTRFTSCDLEEPHYHFEADEIKIHNGEILVARPVRLYFGDVPVAWLPFMAQSLARGRSSGLLTPRFSVNDIVRTSEGYRRRISNVGFYWAMSDYSDATLALDWFSERFISVTSNLRYAWSRQFLDGDLNVRRFWAEDGSRELALDTRHSWEYSERTRVSASARYATSSSFVRENSFDPREVTQTIRSEGGLSHRFDWGSLNAGADRQQFLSDDRVEMTLPKLSLSLRPVTLFEAPPSQAAFYNNLTWNGSFSANRRTQDFADQPLDSAFRSSRLDRIDTRANVSSGLSLGKLSLSQGLGYNETVEQGVPEVLLSRDPGQAGVPLVDLLPPGVSPEDVERVDLSREELTWNAGASFQQRLIGSTTLTPRVNISGRAIRSDTLSAASGFVSAPSRMSLGARLKTDIFGFLPGFGSLERIRHKLSPSFSYDYSPQVTPDALQRQVFGARESQARSVLTFGLNQTFEARVEEQAADTADVAQVPDTAGFGGPGADTTAAGPQPDTAGAAAPTRRADAFDDEGFERVETGRKVTLLSLQTQSVTYDFVQADSAGNFLGGFQTTQLSNSLRSDYLQGLSLQFTHDLFRVDPDGEGGGAGGVDFPESRRSFDPHLSSMNLSFSVNSSSSLFRWLGLGGDAGGGETGEGQPQPRRPPDEEPDPFAPTDQGPDESSIVPGSRRDASRASRRSSAGVGEWRANFSYSLQRPRASTAGTSQMLQSSVNFKPTEHWDVNWRTSFDVERGTFNDQMIRLTRDLHRWEAHFDFMKTVTGNWTFRFQVSLLDNQDLKFDYEQRSRLP